MKRSLNLIRKELDKIRNIKLGSKQLQASKDQIKGQLAMSEENNQNFMLMMAKSILDYGEIKSLDEIFSQIDDISSEQLMDMANEIFGVRRHEPAYLHAQLGIE